MTTKQAEKELRKLVGTLTIDQLRILNLFVAEELMKRNIYDN